MTRANALRPRGRFLFRQRQRGPGIYPRRKSPVYSRSRDADAVQAISTTCLRSSFIFNPATNRSIVSKLFYFCLPATLNPP